MNSFLKQFKKLPTDLKEEIVEKIELFKDPQNHTKLKLHKLNGSFSEFHAFSVNYKIRILVEFISPEHAIFLKIGNHDIYN